MSWAVELIDVYARPTLDGVDLGARLGEVTVLWAPPPQRRAVFRLVVGLERPDHGAVLVSGHDISRASGRKLAKLQRRMAVVFADDQGLFESTTVHENVAYAVRTAGRTPSRRIDLAALTALERHGLAELHDRRPADLSGDQRRALSMARALALGAPLVVVDALHGDFVDVVREESRDRGTTFLVTTGDLDVARRVGDHVVDLVTAG